MNRNESWENKEKQRQIKRGKGRNEGKRKKRNWKNEFRRERVSKDSKRLSRKCCSRRVLAALHCAGANNNQIAICSQQQLFYCSIRSNSCTAHSVLSFSRSGRIHYKATYACEGNPLHLNCEEGRNIHLGKSLSLFYSPSFSLILAVHSADSLKRPPLFRHYR